MRITRNLAVCLLAVAAASWSIPAHASQDAVQFGSNIHVASGAEVHDAVCFFCNVNAEGTVDGDVVVIFGNVRLSGQARHDVVNIFGSVTAEDNALIGHDLVNIMGSVRLGENVSVGQDMVAIISSLSAPASVTVGGNRVFQPAWLLWIPLAFLALIFFGIVELVRAHRRRRYFAGYSYPPRP